MFPLPPFVPTAPLHKTDPWDRFHSQPEVTTHQQIPLTTPNKQLPLLPGESIRSYAAYDLTGTLPAEYETVLNAAAEVVGVRARDIGKVVENIEGRLGKVKRARSRSGSRSRPGSRAQSRGGTSRPPSRAGERGERGVRGAITGRGGTESEVGERNGVEGGGTLSRTSSLRKKRMSTQ
jgi:hypothetical protein